MRLREPAAIVQEASNQLSLDDLAKAIEGEHAAAMEAARTSLGRARRCGEFLLAAKARLPHGQFQKWVRANCTSFSYDSAKGYMRIHLRWGDLEPLLANRDLGVRSALEALGRPKGQHITFSGGPANGLPPPALDAIGCLKLLGDAGLIASPSAIAGACMVTLGDALHEARPGELEAVATPSQAEGFLVMWRVEDAPPVWLCRAPHTTQVPDAVVEAAGRFYAYLQARAGQVPAWEVAAAWWGCQWAATPVQNRGVLPQLMAQWGERFRSSLLYWVDQEGRRPDDEAAHPHHDGQRSDLRHAGVLAAVTEFAAALGRGKATDDWLFAAWGLAMRESAARDDCYLRPTVEICDAVWAEAA